MATLKLEVGKTYRDAGGDKVRIVSQYNNDTYPFDADNGRSYTADGSFWSDGKESKHDLIAEWPDAPTGPGLTVTKREIVPGVYGRITLSSAENGNVVLKFNQAMGGYSTLSISELRAAIATLTEIADALEESR